MTSSTVSPADPFESFYDEWFPQAVVIAKARGVSDAEAAAQEVLLDLFTSDYLDPDGRWARWHDEDFASWIGSIIRRRLISIQRMELRRKTIAPEDTLDNHLWNVEIETPQGYSEFKLLCESIQRELRRQKPHLMELWVEIVRQFLWGEMNGVWINQSQLAEQMGRSKREIRDELYEFRDWLKADGPEMGIDLIDRALTTTG